MAVKVVKQCTKQPILSILICHLPEREESYKRLITALAYQWGPQLVEVLMDDTHVGQATTGRKRNTLLQAARGKYIAYIDDDDMVSLRYVQLIIKSAESSGADCIGMQGIFRRHGKDDWSFLHSILVKDWYQDDSKKTYYRTPNHLNPIKREIAMRVKFPNKTVGEDRAYSDAIRKHLATESFINEPIYYYLK
jgi:glycosyltransferase involved in cell wall biosynthesis